MTELEQPHLPSESLHIERSVCTLVFGSLKDSFGNKYKRIDNIHYDW